MNYTIKTITPSSDVMAIFDDIPSGETRVPVVCWAVRSRGRGSDEVVGMVWGYTTNRLLFVDDDELLVKFKGYAHKRKESP